MNISIENNDNNDNNNNKRIGQSWTTYEEIKLLEEIKNGVSLNEIAFEHKRTMFGIECRLKKIGKRMLKENTTIKQIKQMTRLGASEILGPVYSKKIKKIGITEKPEINHQKRWTLKENVTLLEDVTYMSIDDIRRKYNRTYGAIKSKILKILPELIGDNENNENIKMILGRLNISLN